MTVVRGGQAPRFERDHGFITVLAGPRFSTELTVTRVRLTSSEFDGPHYHDHDKVILVADGVLHALVDGVAETLAAGDALIIGAKSVHDIRCEPGRSCELIIFTPTTSRLFDPDGQEWSVPSVGVGDDAWTTPP